MIDTMHDIYDPPPAPVPLAPAEARAAPLDAGRPRLPRHARRPGRRRLGLGLAIEPMMAVAAP